MWPILATLIARFLKCLRTSRRQEINKGNEVTNISQALKVPRLPNHGRSRTSIH